MQSLVDIVWIAAEGTLAAHVLISILVGVAVAVRWRWNKEFTKWFLLRVTIINYFVSPRVCADWSEDFHLGRRAVEVLRILWILMLVSGVLGLLLALEPLL